MFTIVTRMVTIVRFLGHLIRLIHDRNRASESMVTGIATRGLIRVAPRHIRESITERQSAMTFAPNPRSAFRSADAVMYNGSGRPGDGIVQVTASRRNNRKVPMRNHVQFGLAVAPYVPDWESKPVWKYIHNCHILPTIVTTFSQLSHSPHNCHYFLTIVTRMVTIVRYDGGVTINGKKWTVGRGCTFIETDDPDQAIQYGRVVCFYRVTEHLFVRVAEHGCLPGGSGHMQLVEGHGGLTLYLHVRELRSLVHFAPALPHHKQRHPGCKCAMHVMTTGQYNYTWFQ